MINDLKSKVVLVTGASRGLGKGIAKVLIEAGATVYITGRLHSEPNQFPSVIQTAEELNSLNLGKCVGLYCDHRIEEENEIVFNKIEENHENIDILVNNSFGWFHAKDDFFKNTCWGKDYARKWENTINIGFRLRESHSLKSCYAVSCNALKCSNIQKSLLIFNISSINSYISFFNPAFVFGKEGTDCLTFDMHERLQPFNVNVISLWPGLVRTEIMEKARETVDFIKNIWHASESIYLTGRAILALSTGLALYCFLKILMWQQNPGNLTLSQT
ncbi:hypothetical protein HZS_8120 [Henneguya salminicola]|nr:hypothetical protein HZS_8120 [Henneguya salminicola]